MLTGDAKGSQMQETKIGDLTALLLPSGAVLFRSETIVGQWYVTTLTTCSCQGFYYTGNCKHRKALSQWLLVKQSPTPWESEKPTEIETA
jgi:hypothetical protein